MKQAPEQFRFAAMAVDAVVFSFLEGELCALVAPVHRPPWYINQLGFLGAMITATETAEAACARVLQEKGQLTRVYVEQLYTFSAVARDQRNRVVSVAHLGLVRPDVAAAYAHPVASFVPVRTLKDLAYDHDEMLRVALKRLRGKFEYTTIAQFLLPRYFTLSELQTVYETVLCKAFDKRNFRKKIIALGVVRETGRMEEGVKHRPAALYEFSKQTVQELPLFA